MEKIYGIIRDKDFLAKVVCLALAMFLWAYISSTKTSELKFKVPLEIINLPAYLTIAEMPEKTIELTIEGKKELVKAVSTRSVRAVVDLKKPRVNISARYPVEIIRTQIPESITLTSGVKKISLTVERKIEKRVRVIPKIVGNVPEGYVIGKYSVEPEFIMISGARSLVENTESLFTSNISIEGETDQIVREVEINRDNLTNIDTSENEVKVTIPLLQYSSLLSMELPITIRNMKKNFRYTLKKDKITLYLKTPGNVKITPELFVVYVDAGTIDLKNYKQNPKGFRKVEEIGINVLFKDEIDEVEIVSHTPQKVMVKVTAK
ncbi:MAG TPA: CdaR family protein [Spirochaetota bacterium]|nr:CdaR family protein [Spirochaetota bacterium]